MQINLLSTVGYYGEGVARIADRLLSEGLIDFAGSDAHHQQHIQSFEKPVKLKNIKTLKEVIKNNDFFK